MFREVARKKQALTKEACIALLKEQVRGVLSLQGDDGYPYGLPINYWYCEEDGLLYFHSGPVGHKVDALRHSDKASFCIYDQGYRRDGEWALNIQSVIVFGRIRLLNNNAQTLDRIRHLSYQFTEDTAFIEDTIQKEWSHTLCFVLEPEHITGKLVNES